MTQISITMRHETRRTERRAPIVPADAARMVASGVALTVEESPQRAFPTVDYARAGCRIAAPGSWMRAPDDEYVLGLKELPDIPHALRHRHVFFGHAYKGQRRGPGLLRRFAMGGGVLLDLEYLVDDNGRRLAAFGYWAGYVGAALAVLHHRRRLIAPLQPTSKRALDLELRQSAQRPPVRALVLGALGRCGRGACDALQTASIEPTRWDRGETRPLDTDALLDHDILINAVLVVEPTPPFLTKTVLRRSRRLAMVADVTCDVGSPSNVLPIYHSPTDWREPVLHVNDAGQPLDIIAIDNLPSLLPREASAAFSADLAPQLMSLGEDRRVWRDCAQMFRTYAGSTTEHWR